MNLSTYRNIAAIAMLAILPTACATPWGPKPVVYQPILPPVVEAAPVVEVAPVVVVAPAPVVKPAARPSNRPAPGVIPEGVTRGSVLL